MVERGALEKLCLGFPGPGVRIPLPPFSTFPRQISFVDNPVRWLGNPSNTTLFILVITIYLNYRTMGGSLRGQSFSSRPFVRSSVLYIYAGPLKCPKSSCNNRYPKS